MKSVPCANWLGRQAGRQAGKQQAGRQAGKQEGRRSQRKRTVPLSCSTYTGKSAVQYKLKSIHPAVIVNKK